MASSSHRGVGGTGANQSRARAGLESPLRFIIQFLRAAGDGVASMWNLDAGRRRVMADDVTAPSPLMVSLIQPAVNLPYFLLGLVAGALPTSPIEDDC